MAADVVPDGGALVLRNELEVREDRLDGAVRPLTALERLVRVVDVRLVVLVVVDAHRLLVDVRLERVVVVRQRRDLESHRSLLYRKYSEDMLPGHGLARIQIRGDHAAGVEARAARARWHLARNDRSSLQAL